MTKQVEVWCTSEVATLISAALEWFVECTYPRASDECSAAVRETLLDLAGRFKRELLIDCTTLYSSRSRIRAFLCEAVRVTCPSKKPILDKPTSTLSGAHRCLPG